MRLQVSIANIWEHDQVALRQHPPEINLAFNALETIAKHRQIRQRKRPIVRNVIESTCESSVNPMRQGEEQTSCVIDKHGHIRNGFHGKALRCFSYSSQ